MAELRSRGEPAPEPRPEPDPPVTRIARQLALAHLIEQSIEKGLVDDYAAAAEVLCLSRARVTQIMSLLLLAPPIQEAILDGHIRAAARALWAVSAEPSWEVQLRRSGNKLSRETMETEDREARTVYHRRSGSPGASKHHKTHLPLGARGHDEEHEAKEVIET